MEKILKNTVFLFVFLLKVYTIYSEKLPDFIEPCSQNETDISECFINQSIKAIPGLIKGVDYLKIPVLSPLLLKKIELIDTDNLKLSFQNLTATGLETAKTLDAKVDLVKKRIAADIHFDYLAFEGTYFVNGRILILPIMGSGAAKIAFDDVVMHFSTEYELKSKNQTDYMHLKNSKIPYNLKHASYELKGLFNGDEFLAQQTNKFLNENWEALHQEFSPVISEAIKGVVLNILERIVNVIPFDEIFVPK